MAPQDEHPPYHSQWETPALAADIIAGTALPATDPRWMESGAASAGEYGHWANHLCGMACLKMALAADTGATWKTMELARLAVRHGAYVESEGAIRGLIYAPFVEMLRRELGADARVVTEARAADIAAILESARFFMASVHPWIRWPDSTPPCRGGHLVLVIAAAGGALTFHNPSGDTPESQQSVVLPAERFDRFFAGRGIALDRFGG